MRLLSLPSALRAFLADIMNLEHVRKNDGTTLQSGSAAVIGERTWARCRKAHLRLPVCFALSRFGE